MAREQAAVELAELCVAIGAAHGRRTAALVTDMSQPLGDAIGNALEVAASIDVLRGAGSLRLREVSLELAAAALELLGEPRDVALARVTGLLDDGSALVAFRALVVAQGGDGSVVDDPRAVLPAAPVVRSWTPPTGFVTRIACRRLGEVAGMLGAGRSRAGESVDPAVGLELLVRVGDLVGDAPAVRVHAASEADAERAMEKLSHCIHVGTDPVEAPALVLRRVGFSGDPGDPGEPVGA